PTHAKLSGQIHLNLEPCLSVLVENDSLSGARPNIPFPKPSARLLEALGCFLVFVKNARGWNVLELVRQEPAARQRQGDRGREGKAAAQGDPALDRLAAGQRQGMTQIVGNRRRRPRVGQPGAEEVREEPVKFVAVAPPPRRVKRRRFDNS